MKTYFKAIGILFFFLLVIEGVLRDFFILVGAIIGTDASFHIAAILGNLVAYGISLTLGIYFAVKRIWKDTPWSMTPLRQSLLFGCIYHFIQSILLSDQSLITSLSGGPPDGWRYLGYLFCSPGILFLRKFSSPTLGFSVALFSNSVVWTIVFSSFLLIIRKVKSLEIDPFENLKKYHGLRRK